MTLLYFCIVKSEWINCPETLPPPMMYFDETKYCAWSYNNDLAEVRIYSSYTATTQHLAHK